jgi:L-ribulose-5-phosphate 3-epimerase
MSSFITRRDFLASTAAAGLGAGLAGRQGFAAEVPTQEPNKEPQWKTTLHKALIGSPDENTLNRWKAVGFEGYDMSWDDWNARVKKDASLKPADAKKTADALGMTIHSVLFGWGGCNLGDAKLNETVANVTAALQAAAEFGATTVLFVPCKIGEMPMPEPWEFDIRHDKKSGRLQQVVAGDNAKYRQYIDAHNQAVVASRECVEKLIPAAEKSGVILALENVWNNLWVKPDVFADFVASFDSRWVKAYFDIGNHVKYAPPQEWIRRLGALIVKCHVKDFKLNPDGRDGRFCDIREGSVDWPAVRQSLDTIGYNGWLTIEGSDLSLAEQSRRLEWIVAGK